MYYMMSLLLGGKLHVIKMIKHSTTFFHVHVMSELHLVKKAQFLFK